MEAIKQYRNGKFDNPKTLPKAIAGILETEINNPEYREFAVNNYSQIVNIITKYNPDYLAIKKDIQGEMLFHVDNDIIEPY